MKHKRKGIQLIMLFALVVIGGLYFPHQQAYAAASAVQVAAVEYYDENIVVFNNENTKIYFATDTEAANNKWECVPADSGRFTTIDISWLSPTTDNAIVIKGDQNTTKTRALIRKKPQKLTVTIDYANIDNLYNADPNQSIAPLVNIMTTEGTAADPIIFEDLEWSKGDNGQWKNANTLTVAQIEKFLVRGTYVSFRIMAVDDCVTVNDGSNIDFKQRRIDGYGGGICAFDYLTDDAFLHGATDYIPDGTMGRRFSTTYKVKIAKKATTMVSGVNGEKFTAAITYGKEYRVTTKYADGTTGKSDWIKVTDRATKTVALDTIANGAAPKFNRNGSDVVFNGTTEAFPEMHIEIRSYATSNASSSKITNIDLDAQRTLTKAIQKGLPDYTKTQTNSDIYVDYYGNKYITLIIPMASTDQPYEYTFVKKGGTFDLAHASWSVVTKNTGVKILASKALQDSTLYVRQREIKSRTATSTTSAVSYKLASTYQSVTISYPYVPMISTNPLVFVKGYTTSLTLDIQLTESGRDQFEDTVTSVKLGTKEIHFTSSTTGDVLTLSLNCDEIKTMANCTDRTLTITFAKGTVDKTSAKITIKNPTPAGSLTLLAGPGDASGDTKIVMQGAAASGNSLVYVFSDAVVTDKNIEDTLSGVTTQTFVSGDNINVAGKNYITVYEINSTTQNIVRYRSIQITSSIYKQ